MSKQRIVALDVETAPALAWVWKTGQQFVSLGQITEPSRMLCFAARFNDKKRTEFHAEWDDGGHEGMVAQMRRILDEADAVLHFNGKTFDVPWMRTEIIRAGLTPPSPYKQIDLYQQTRNFRLDSHKLEHVSTHLLQLEGKVEHSGFGLWLKVMAGDPKARALFKRYNVRDVDVLWEAYDALLPWLKLPDANLYTDGTEPVCTNCGRPNPQSRGVETTVASTYQRYWCNPEVGGCGAWSRGRARLTGSQRMGLA